MIVATPVAAHTTCTEIADLVDRVICPIQPPHLNAVGTWYNDFSQTSDNDVIELLTKSKHFQR
jgi:predicted phosphoribosyltransferase